MMSFEEKSTWVMALFGPTAFGIYVVVMLQRLGDTPVTEVAYQWPLVTTIGIAIAATIVAHIAIAIANPREADQKDLRDVQINRYGEYVGGYVLGVGAVGVLLLALGEYAHFWIANGLYLVFVLSNTTASVIKLVAYRRGFCA